VLLPEALPLALIYDGAVASNEAWPISIVTFGSASIALQVLLARPEGFEPPTL
jgi:hypothetical protein